ncbi:ASPIC/UnbV domain-containing protein [Verrucomicrobiaceae bacterium 227]
MRQDETIGGKLRKSKAWDRDPQTGMVDHLLDARVETGDEVVDGKLRVHSLSGHERNKLYLNDGKGSNFSDQSGLSGLDDEADGRAFAIFDYDRDGWSDIVSVNAMNPLTRLFHNEMSDQARSGHFIALSFRGGNRTAMKSDWSSRDGYGARVEVRKGEETIEREHRCGQGYGSQNSAVMMVGLGDWEEIDEVIVRWPSGRKSTVTKVKHGEWLTVDERSGVERKPYLRAADSKQKSLPGLATFPLGYQSKARLTVWKGMATWCPACARYLPHFEQLKTMTQGLGVEFRGFPLDEKEDRETLIAYQNDHKLPYDLLTDLSMLDRKKAVVFLQRWIGAAELPTPTSVVTNQRGEILWVGAGAPTVSELRRFLATE